MKTALGSLLVEYLAGSALRRARCAWARRRPML